MSTSQAIDPAGVEVPEGYARVDVPAYVDFLWEPHRYKALWGGRNGIKSWSMARVLLATGTARPLRVICLRETMRTIKDSVHTLLEDQIKAMQLGYYYDVQATSIRHREFDTRFVYAGLQALIRDSTALKAYESFDIAWIEEAQTVSHESLKVLIPTMRKSGSEIWFSFNPMLATDPICDFLFKNPPPGLAIKKTSWRNNLWLTDEARADMDYLKQTDPDEYDHVYEGEFVRTVKGAIYARELDKVDKDGRISKVVKAPGKPVHSAWDIGDRWTSIWLFQRLPMEIRVLKYIHGENLGLSDYVKLLQDEQHIYGTHYLPWDGGSHNQLGTGKTIRAQLQDDYGYRVDIVPRRLIKDQHNAARELFPIVWFDEEGCQDGIHGLRYYRWPDEGGQGQLSGEPLHDWASHPGSAFNYLCMAASGETEQAAGRPTPSPSVSSPWV